MPYRLKEIHDRYGTVVRIAPNELSFIDSAAWKDIYSHKEFIRPPQFRNRLPGKNADHFISADVQDHARFRKAFSPAFAEKGLRDQEEILQSYVSKLMERFQQKIDQDPSKTSATLNVVEWFNYTTFDIIGDLGWGSSFNCLETAEYHPWVTVVLQFQAVFIAASLKYYPWLDKLAQSMTPPSAKNAMKLITSTAEENVQSRLAQGTERNDILSYAISHNKKSPDSALSIEEMECNSMAFIVGGSDTITTGLVGTVNCLLNRPDSLATLVKEIRSAFSSEEEITSTTTNRLPYLNAVLEEGLRMCPPVPDIMRREIPSGGATIAGNPLPGHTVVGIPCWPMFQSSKNFTKPSEFHPERWLPGAEKTFNDNQAAFQPFATGPANCIGQNLARIELRIILTRLLWRYDIAIPEGEKPFKWTEQKIWWSWEKPMVKVKISKAR